MFFSDGRIIYDPLRKDFVLNFRGDGASPIVQNVKTLVATQEANIYHVYFEISLGEIIESKGAYFYQGQLSSNWRPVGQFIDDISLKAYFIVSNNNSTGWIVDDAGNRLRTDLFSEKTLRGYIDYIPATQ